ncbi:hypothetical protein FF1_043771 [Malus domestica]
MGGGGTQPIVAVLAAGLFVINKMKSKSKQKSMILGDIWADPKFSIRISKSVQQCPLLGRSDQSLAFSTQRSDFIVATNQATERPLSPSHSNIEETIEVGDHKRGYLSSADIALVQGRVAVLDLRTSSTMKETLGLRTSEDPNERYEKNDLGVLKFARNAVIHVNKCLAEAGEKRMPQKHKDPMLQVSQD